MSEMMSLRQMSLFMLIAFCVFSALMFVFHENHISMVGNNSPSNKFFHRLGVMIVEMEEKVVDRLVSFEEAVVNEFVSDREIDDKESAYDDAKANKMEEVPSSSSSSSTNNGDKKQSPASASSAPLLRGSSNANPITSPGDTSSTPSTPTKSKPKKGRDGAIHLLQGTALRDLGKRTRTAPDVYKDISPSEDDFNDDSVSVTMKDAQGNIVVLQKTKKS